MTVLVDTPVLIDHLRGNNDARQVLRTAADSGRRGAASVVAKVEVLAGMRTAEELKHFPMFPQLASPCGERGNLVIALRGSRRHADSGHRYGQEPVRVAANWSVDATEEQR